MKRLILGTAGHIDHGKTSLVQALTGTNTDRLKEEKERGITIDLGFAEFAPAPDLQFGVVDVPGHEGFIRNMVAGATGMDLVLLAVACDEGVMPQTREHLDILEILGVRKLVVAMTKADSVDEEWIDLVVEDTRRVIAQRSFADSPVVPTSVTTGLGLDQIMSHLVEQAKNSKQRTSDDLVRMPVDRVFSIRGTGTVATGTLWGGSITKGREINFQPSRISGRIRGLEVHGQQVDKAFAGQRVAVAVSGGSISTETLQRGQVIVDSLEWSVSSIVTVEIQTINSSSWLIKHGQRLRIHLGTDEVMARVILLDSKEIFPGGKGWAQLRLERPLLARVGDRLVVRSYSPVTTIGGAVVAEVSALKRNTISLKEVDLLKTVTRGSGEEILEATIGLGGSRGVTKTDLPIKTGLSPEICRNLVEKTITKGFKETSNEVFGATVGKDITSKIKEVVTNFHEKFPLSKGMSIESIRNDAAVDDGGKLADLLIDEMVRNEVMKVEDGLVGLVGHTVDLNPDQELLAARILELYENYGLEAPEVRLLPESLSKKDDLWPMLKYLESRGDLVGLDQELFIKTSVIEMTLERVINELGGQKNLAPSDFKKIVPVSRKFLIPILNHMDKEGVTVKEGDNRMVTKGN